MCATDIVTAFGDDVGGAELAGQLLSWLVSAHGDDPRGAHPGSGQHTEQPDGAVTDDGDGHSRLHVGGDGGEPAGPHHIRQGEQAGDEGVVRLAGGGDEGAVGERDAEQSAWAPQTSSRCWQEGWNPAWQFGQVLSEAKKEPMTNWPGLMDRTSLPTSSTMPQYSCPIGVGWVTGLMPR
jgi:hypothetical protein